MLKLIEINCKFHDMNVVSNKMLLGCALLGSGHALLVFFMFYNGEKPFWVGLFDQLFQPARNQVEMVEKAFV